MKNYTSLLLFCILFSQLNAQRGVPVIKEPHHKPVLVNKYIRLLDVHINPGDTTLYHVHNSPCVILFISHSTIGSQKSGEAPLAANEVFPGQTNFIDYSANPITHRVFNAGKNVFHVMDIELAKQAPSTDSCKPISEPNVETTINNKLVRVYKFDVTSHQAFNTQQTSCAHLLVCISGDISASNKKLKEGDYAFFNPNTKISINNNQNEKATCVLLELK